MEATAALEFVTKAFDAGKSVIVSTYTKRTKYGPKHRAMFKLGKDGSLLVQRGKSWDCIALPSRLMVCLTIA